MRVQIQFDGERIGDLFVGDDGRLKIDGDATVLEPLANRYIANLIDNEGVQEPTAEDVLGSLLDKLQGRYAAIKVGDFPDDPEEDDDGEGDGDGETALATAEGGGARTPM